MPLDQSVLLRIESGERVLRQQLRRSRVPPPARSFCIPKRMRVFTVPNGVSSAAAISDCVMPL